jgi:pantetheine-phosphate adenylyltransferase
MNKKAVYAGAFDPMTNGHLWMIEKASQLFDVLVVAIGENHEKSYTFSVDERIEFLRATTMHLPNVEVVHFHNEFLVNFAKKIGAKFMVRGIRNAQDYEYEKVMRHINYDLNSEIETILLLPPRKFAEVSSSLIKGLVGSVGWESVVGQYVPPIVLNNLAQLYNSLQAQPINIGNTNETS